MNIKQIQQAMKQAQNMQNDMTKIKDEIEKKEFTHSAGGGVLNIAMLGNKKITKIDISKELLEEDEKEMLEELLVRSINNLSEEIDKEFDEKMGPLTQGLPF